MKKSELHKKAGVILDLSDNSEKDTILRTIITSGEFEVQDIHGIVTLHLKEKKLQKKYINVSRIVISKKGTPSVFSFSKREKNKGLLEHIAKSQNITLASNDSSNAICSGVIV